MSVYVDQLFDTRGAKRRSWRWPSACHLYADSAAELHLFAARLGLAREWCSDHTQPNCAILHYDLNSVMRAKALKLGAVETTFRHLVSLFMGAKN